MNTSAKGDRLRDDVHTLLAAAGKQGLAKEKSLAGKKCDVYYEDDLIVPGRRFRFAIECKDYERPLTREQIVAIVTDYQAVRGAFDHLLVVTRHGISSSCLDTIEATEWAAHEEYPKFCSRLLDFTSYLHGLEALFSEEGLDQYYEPVLDTAGRSIEKLVGDWIDGESSQPKAILASYGMGKTSLSKRLAYRYASARLRGGLSRIPIYLRLGDIASEQKIEGLICRHFAHDNIVSGFNYPLFAEFNRRGRFLIILDGFDEMKHAMTFEAFEYNIEQIRRLIVPRSRVILLGRPNAFLSEDEKDSVLHGIESLGDERIRNAAIADFEEVEVGAFTRTQLERFVGRYIRYLAGLHDGRSYDEAWLEHRIQEILDPGYQHLISRPVHARMMIVIGLSTDTPLERFSRYVLYEKFFEHILRREQHKLARQGVLGEDRIRFAQTVAWLGWVGDESRSITTRTLRRALRAIGVEASGDAQLREFVIGSVLEPKPPNAYYFAHRSFFEFLSAQYLLEASLTPALLSDIGKHLNTEILTFVRESGRANVFAVAVLDVLASYSGSVPMSLLRFLAEAAEPDRSFGIADTGSVIGAGPVLVRVLSLGDFPLEKIEDQMLEAITPMRETPAKLALLVGVCIRAYRCTDEKTLLEVGAALLGTLHMAAFDVMKRRREGGRRTAASDTDDLIWARLLVGSVTAHFTRDELNTLELDLQVLTDQSVLALRGWLQIEDIESPAPRKITVPRLESTRVLRRAVSSYDSPEKERAARQNEHQIVASFWRSDPHVADFVSISTRTRPPPIVDHARRLSLRRDGS